MYLSYSLPKCVYIMTKCLKGPRFLKLGLLYLSLKGSKGNIQGRYLFSGHSFIIFRGYIITYTLGP
jgi:hypothetical protein